jgi:hypothetical protein
MHRVIRSHHHEGARLRRCRRQRHESGAPGVHHPPPERRALRPRWLTPFGLVLVALSLGSYLALAICIGNGIRSVVELGAYVQATPDVRVMRVTEARIIGGPPIQDWTSGPHAVQRGSRFCRLDLVTGTTHYLSGLDQGVCRSVAEGDSLQARVWNGRVTEVEVQGQTWRTFWHPFTGVFAWFVWGVLLLPVVALFTLALRLDLHGRAHRALRRLQRRRPFTRRATNK